MSFLAASREARSSTLAEKPRDSTFDSALISAATFWAASRFRSRMAVLTPCAARARAMVEQITPPPPVTTATLPLRFKSLIAAVIMLIFYFINGCHQFFHFGSKSGKISFFKKLLGEKVGAHTHTSHSGTEPAFKVGFGGVYPAGRHDEIGR